MITSKNYKDSKQKASFRIFEMDLSKSDVHKFRKEDKEWDGFKVLDKDFNVLVDVRCYYTQTRTYCCVWVNNPQSGYYVAGGSFAGGYGYHRASQAFEDALKKAGIMFSRSIGGVGKQAMEEAAFAICKAFNARKTYHLVSCHA